VFHELHTLSFILIPVLLSTCLTASQILSLKRTISPSLFLRVSLPQTYQVSSISQETPAFWSQLPLNHRIIKISRISSIQFDQLILSKMVKIIATRCHILRLKCTKFDFGWGSAPDLVGGVHVQHFPDILAGFNGSYF